LKIDICKSESSQSDEGRAQSSGYWKAQKTVDSCLFLGELISKPVTAVFLASRRIDCVALAPYFQLVPFFYITSSARSCDEDLNYNRLV